MPSMYDIFALPYYQDYIRAVPYGFHGDKTLIASHETLSFSLLVMSTNLIIFNTMKLY